MAAKPGPLPRRSSHAARASLLDVQERLRKAGAIDGRFLRLETALSQVGNIAPRGDCAQPTVGLEYAPWTG